MSADHLPEQMHYRDDGCSIAPRCLDCPLPACRYDLPPKRAGWVEQGRLRYPPRQTYLVPTSHLLRVAAWLPGPEAAL